MRKLRISIIFAAFSVLCLGGCSAFRNNNGELPGEITDRTNDSRQELIYGTQWLDSDVQEQIVKFNMKNESYYITVKEYGGSESDIMRLQTELASGNGPDIINLYGVGDISPFMEQGYLEDLTPYLEESGLSDQIMWQVLEIYQPEQKVYMLMPHFTYSGLIISPIDAPDMDNWNIDTMFSLIEENHAKKNIFTNSSENRILSTALWGMQGSFIDWESKTAYFDSPEFLQLLQFCKEYGRETDWGSDTISMEEMATQTLFLGMTFSSTYEYMSLFSSYGRDIPIYGYPTTEGYLYLIHPVTDACGLYVGSRHKEGAWEFMQTLLETSYQESDRLMGWPICLDSYEKVLVRAEQQSVVIGDYRIEGLSDSEIAILREIVMSGNLQPDLLETKIREVVLEEAKTFFDGNRTAETVAANIQNRVQLILDE